MRAVLVDTFGGPEALIVHDIPTPTPGPTDVIVKVAVSGVNFIDVYFRTGLYKMPPPVAIAPPIPAAPPAAVLPPVKL